jgi:hypothetical protein
MEELIKTLSIQDLFEQRRMHHQKLKDKIVVIKPSFDSCWCIYSIFVNAYLTDGTVLSSIGVGQTSNLKQRAKEYKSRLVTGASTPNTGEAMLAKQLASAIGSDQIETLELIFDVLISDGDKITKGDKRRLEYLCQQKLKEEYGQFFHSNVAKPNLCFDDEEINTDWKKGKLWALL